jgi:hypothetical protein
MPDMRSSVFYSYSSHSKTISWQRHNEARMVADCSVSISLRDGMGENWEEFEKRRDNSNSYAEFILAYLHDLQ